VKTESLEWLANNPFLHQALRLLCGTTLPDSSVKAVADELWLDWHTVKELDKQYMAEQLRRASRPAPTAIGIDEIAIGKGHSYRIIVSDLNRGRPIWFGGQDRSEASVDQFFAWLGREKSSKIRLAVMDCARRFAIPPSRKGMPHRQRSSTTSFTCCGICKTPWIRFAKANTLV
jgi:transposase